MYIQLLIPFLSIILTIAILTNGWKAYKLFAIIPFILIPISYVLPILPFGVLFFAIETSLYSWIRIKKAHIIAEDDSITVEQVDKFENLL